MNRLLIVLFVVLIVQVRPGHAGAASPDSDGFCTQEWYRFIDNKVATGDGRGHGPDLGSTEWQSVVEFKLGIRGKAEVPQRNSDAWCHHIDQIVRNSRMGETKNGKSSRSAKADAPSFTCNSVKPGSIEAMVCADAELSALDRKLAEVFAAASKKATNEHPPVLKAEQRGWIKGRNDCWKSENQHGCVQEEYTRRIAELQARYRLVPFNGPVQFVCDGNPANEVITTFFQTEPPTLIAERGDETSFMILQPSGSGTRYQGRNETFWEHQGAATITWGYGQPEMHCKKAP
ncbi:MAG: MliC family protein [Chlorobium sp.]|nr:MliC family protein [Chlorobium sp.]